MFENKTKIEEYNRVLEEKYRQLKIYLDEETYNIELITDSGHPTYDLWVRCLERDKDEELLKIFEQLDLEVGYEEKVYVIEYDQHIISIFLNLKDFSSP